MNSRAPSIFMKNPVKQVPVCLPIKRFPQIAGGTELSSVNELCRIVCRRHHNDRDCWVTIAYVAKHGDAVDYGEVQIKKDTMNQRMRRLQRNARKSRMSIVLHHHVKSHRREPVAKRDANVLVIFHYENSFRQRLLTTCPPAIGECIA